MMWLSKICRPKLFSISFSSLKNNVSLIVIYSYLVFFFIHNKFSAAEKKTTSYREFQSGNGKTFHFILHALLISHDTDTKMEVLSLFFISME